jgi:uncharacterized protein YndB with AHSA1/START domain
VNTIDSITHEIQFTVSCETLWTALTDPKEVKQWFGSDAHFILAEGEQGYFEWAQECEGKFAMCIVKVDKPHYLAWRWMHDADVPFDEHTSTLVEWSISPLDDGGCRLELKESGFASLKHRKDNVEGWEQELADLEGYLA